MNLSVKRIDVQHTAARVERMNPGRSQADELRVETSLLEEGGHVEDVLVSLHGNARFSVQVKQTELLALGHRQVEFVAHLIDAVLHHLQHATEHGGKQTTCTYMYMNKEARNSI